MNPSSQSQINMADYKGKPFEKAFSKLVRKLDKMRMRLNDKLKEKFFASRPEELEVQYEQIYKKMLFHAAISEEDYSPQRE